MRFLWTLLPWIGGAWAMEKEAVGRMLRALADPAGAPSPPAVFQFLLVFTWALHMVFVYAAVGGLFLALYGMTRRDGRWQRLSGFALDLAKVSVSIAIVLGVAPLLFYQVIYDALWYASANLSAAWYIMFILLLLLGYYALWGAYLAKRRPALAKGFSLLSVALLLAVGFIIHVVNYQALYPERWVEWYTSGGTTMNHSGWGIYAFNPFRYLAFFLFPAVAFTGLFLMLYAWYYGARGDMDQGYLDWVGRMGARTASLFGLLWLAAHALYAFTTPADWGVRLSVPTFLSLAVLGLGVAFWARAQGNPRSLALPSFLAGLVAMLFVAVFREYARVGALAQFGYSIYGYKTNLEWLSPLLFLGTALVGFLLYGYTWLLAYRAGRTERGQVYEPRPWESRLGWLALSAILLWTALFLGVGLVVILRNQA